MFEISVALRYLVPRRRQLSVSIIALVSVLVISLVVWLVVVFLSVTEGIEKRWLANLVNLNAPIRLTPTDAYYNSYYYQVDGHSLESNYSHRSIAEKLAAGFGDPYDATLDPELPMGFPLPDLDESGALRDPVQGAFEIAAAIPGVKARDFEMGLGNLRLRLLRGKRGSPQEPMQFTQSFVSQVSYLSAFDPDNQHVARTLLPPTAEDVSQCLEGLAFAADAAREESPSGDRPIALDALRERLGTFFDNVAVQGLQTRPEGWILPRELYPEKGELQASLVRRGGVVQEVRLDDAGEEEARIRFTRDGAELLTGEGAVALPPHAPLLVHGGMPLAGGIDLASLESARGIEELQVDVAFDLQGHHFSGRVPYRGLEIGDAQIRRDNPEQAPVWVHRMGKNQVLPVDAEGSYGVLVAKSFQESDVHVGDRGYVSYYAGTPSSVQEQRIPIYVAGFYDPGLLPIGSKMVLVPRAITSDLQGSLTQAERGQANGVGLWFDNIKQVDGVRDQMVAGLSAAGLLPYWKVETYKEFDFARPLVQQFESDRNLFFLIAAIVILVACSNIISMLLLLVNDKRREIGILQSMGATRSSIAAIFALCGIVMGGLGSALGIGAAYLTLQNLDLLVSWMSRLQGHEAFQTLFFGDSLPNEISVSVLSFVVGATVVISLIAGLAPAIKATRVRPSEILRSQ